MKELEVNNDDDSQWLPISDLMSVLMMIFLLIAVSYMLKVYQEKEKIEEVAITYNKLQNELYNDIRDEFENDLIKWNAEIDKSSLSVRFKAPEILFSQGSANIKLKFKVILEDFYPRFINILYSEKYRKEIEEIRIEGHTSSKWRSSTPENVAYIHNMELSQSRTRNVLKFILNLEQDNVRIDWLKKYVTANGLSSSKLIYDDNNIENYELSRRVEFRIKTNAEKRIAKILNQ